MDRGEGGRRGVFSGDEGHLQEEECDAVSDICQLDGNGSLSSNMSLEEENNRENKEQEEGEQGERVEDGTGDQTFLIPVVVGNRPAKPRSVERVPVWTAVRRNNKLVDALSAPRISLYNARSVFSKLDNLSVDMNMMMTDLYFLTEV